MGIRYLRYPAQLSELRRSAAKGATLRHNAHKEEVRHFRRRAIPYGARVRILLLCSSFNGLTQRIRAEAQADGHEVEHRVVSTAADMRAAVAATAPELVLCPFLTRRIPAEVWERHRTIVIHPGPEGDRGPSALDWAIVDGHRRWGVTALQAVEQFDAGPIWASRSIRIPATPPRKSELYAGPVTEAAVALVREVLAKAAAPTFVPRPVLDGTARPLMRPADRTFSWTDPTADVLRRIRAADGSPGVRTVLADLPVSVFDAHPEPEPPAGEPGSILLRRHGAVLVRTGDGGVWIGHAKHRSPAPTRRIKLPAVMLLGERVADVPEALDPLTAEGLGGYREITYRRRGPVGVLRFDFYNGAMSTAQCQRLTAALRCATAADTSVLVVQGGPVFSNGIHLNVIEAAADPRAEAWRNINAIDDACREIITCTRQLVVTAIAGNAGAGGVMLGLGADRVLARAGVVLNPHYRTMGLHGSEYWSYTLPRRVGRLEAERLTAECLPIGAAAAQRIGLVDAVLPRAGFDAAVLDHATELATGPELPAMLAAKAAARATDESFRRLKSYRLHELSEMARDIFDDRSGFAAARRAFVTKAPAVPRLPAQRLAPVADEEIRSPAS